MNGLLDGLLMHLPILPVLLPAGTAILLLLIGDHGGGDEAGHTSAKLTWCRRIALGSTMLFALMAAVLVAGAAGGDLNAYRVGDWPAPYGIVVVIDRLGAMMLLLVAVAGWVTAYGLPGAGRAVAGVG